MWAYIEALHIYKKISAPQQFEIMVEVVQFLAQFIPSAELTLLMTIIATMCRLVWCNFVLLALYSPLPD